MIIYTILFLIIDILSKVIVCLSIDVNKSIIMIKNFFSLTYVRNTGAAFSIFLGQRFFLIIISAIIIFTLIYYVIRHKPSNLYEKISFSMIIGGSIGNFLNRVFLGYVIDFLDFNLFGYDYPIFNLADSFIFVGVLLLLIESWKVKK